MPVASGPRHLVCSRRSHTAAAQRCVALTRQRRATVVYTQVHTRIARGVHVFAQPENAKRICSQHMFVHQTYSKLDTLHINMYMKEDM